MGFAVGLEPPRQVPSTVADVDTTADYDTLVIQACEVLERTDCRFLVGGFGQPVWPVDVGYDLSSLIEQLPGLLKDLRAGNEGEVSFYGQGIERTLSFERRGHQVRIQCRSGTDWVPDPDIEVLDMDDLVEILVEVSIQFAAGLKMARSPLANLPPFSSWLAGDV
jgi:hypothetical protein